MDFVQRKEHRIQQIEALREIVAKIGKLNIKRKRWDSYQIWSYMYNEITAALERNRFIIVNDKSPIFELRRHSNNYTLVMLRNNNSCLYRGFKINDPEEFTIEELSKMLANYGLIIREIDIKKDYTYYKQDPTIQKVFLVEFAS